MIYANIYLIQNRKALNRTIRKFKNGGLDDYDLMKERKRIREHDLKMQFYRTIRRPIREKLLKGETK